MGPPQDVTAKEKGGSLAKSVWETALEQIQSPHCQTKSCNVLMCKVIVRRSHSALTSLGIAPGLLSLSSFESQVQVLLSGGVDKLRKRPAELWVWTTATQTKRWRGFYPIKTHQEEPGKVDLSE